MRLEERRLDAPGEAPEGYFTSHLVWVALSPVRAEISQSGRWTTIYPQPGDVIVVPAGMPYASRWTTPSEGVLISLNPASLTAITEGDGSDLRHEIRPVVAAKQPLMAQIGLALRDDVLFGNSGNRLYRETLAAAFAMALVSTYAVAPIGFRDRRGGLPANRLRQVLDYINARLDAPISLFDLAGVADIAVYHFAHLFKETMGCAPHQYVLNQRIERATSLLRDTNLTIAEIALRCGFSDQSHLANTFRRTIGVTPRAYRRSF
jgi:AraC family transcriptional regulator